MFNLDELFDNEDNNRESAQFEERLSVAEMVRSVFGEDIEIVFEPYDNDGMTTYNKGDKN